MRRLNWKRWCIPILLLVLLFGCRGEKPQLENPEAVSVKETTDQQEHSEKNGNSEIPEEETQLFSLERVANYIHKHGELPSEYVTKKEAREAGWNSKEGNLWDVLPGKAIGGDRFGNREGRLPDEQGRQWTEADLNYNGGHRGPDRIVFSNDGLIYYTLDHYNSFTLWEAEE